MELEMPGNHLHFGDILHMVVRKHPLKTAPYMVIYKYGSGVGVQKVRKCKKNLKYFKKSELLK